MENPSVLVLFYKIRIFYYLDPKIILMNYTYYSELIISCKSALE